MLELPLDAILPTHFPLSFKASRLRALAKKLFPRCIYPGGLPFRLKYRLARGRRRQNRVRGSCVPLVTFVTRNSQKQPPAWEEDVDVICGVNVGRNESQAQIKYI
jgi:hypothetical protein